MKTKIAYIVLFFALAAFVSGATMLALATPGSQEDPFITLGYLNDNFKTQMMDEIKESEQQLLAEIDGKIADLENRLALAHGDAVSAPGIADAFSVVTLSSGQSITCSTGTEIMLRIGSATGFGSAPALVNYTSGEPLSAGSDLATNHMYLITIEGNGIRATAETVRVLIRGNYTIS